MKTSTVVWISLLLLTACSPAAPKARYIWPVPPFPAKLEFLDNIYRAEDLKPDQNRLKMAVLKGEEPLFKSPFDLLIRKDGSFVVSDSQNNLLWVLQKNGKKRALPLGDRGLNFPLGLAEDTKGNLYVAEGQGRRIAVIDPEGRVTRYIGKNRFAGKPTFLVIDSKRDRIYASDTSQHRIEVFTLEGKHLQTIGSPGTEPGQLAAPQGVAFNKNHELLVAEMLNARLSVFDSEGNFLRVIPFTGWDPYVFNAPKGLAVGADGKIWVTDQRIGALVAYGEDEKPEVVVSAGRMSTHPMAFAAPSGLAVSEGGSLWVTDLLLRRIGHWQELTPEYLKAHPFDQATRERLAAYGKINTTK